MTDREKIAARIRALLAKTVENGCTEDEAVAAAEKAAEMLDRYNLTIDEVQLRENPFKRADQEQNDDIGRVLWKVAKAISELTDTRYWTASVGSAAQISFFGYEHEVDVATYLLAICERAMKDGRDRLLIRYALLTPAAKRRKLIPFLDGMADSLARRIRALIKPKPTGTGLVVLKGELIDLAMKDAGIVTKKRDMRSSRDLDETYRKGVEAGDRVALNPGVGANQRPTQYIT